MFFLLVDSYNIYIYYYYYYCYYYYYYQSWLISTQYIPINVAKKKIE